MTEDHRRGGRSLSKAGFGPCNHLLRGVAPKDGNALVREKEGVLTCSAIEFKDGITRLEGLAQDLPYGLALCAADQRLRKDAVVAGSQAIEHCACRDSRGETELTHASLSWSVASKPCRDAAICIVSCWSSVGSHTPAPVSLAFC